MHAHSARLPLFSSALRAKLKHVDYPICAALLQGIRQGEIHYVPAASQIPPSAAEAQISIRLRDFGFVEDSAEEFSLLLNTRANINLSGLSSEFRNNWKLAWLSVQKTNGDERIVLDIPFHPSSAVNLDIQALSGFTKASWVIQPDQHHGGRIWHRADILYTACFVRRSEEAPAPAQSSCLSLTNNNDVVFVFPFESASAPRILWANKAKLSRACVYFASLVSGGFEESGRTLSNVSKMLVAFKQDLAKIVAIERAKGARDSSLADDSDNEGEANWHDVKEKRIPGDEDSEGAIQYVIIRHTPYKTYRALFEWIETRQRIAFASLKSSAVPEPRSSVRASPKSVYRLCHQLGMDELKAMALENFEAQLRPFNVLHELFSTNSFYYPELRAAALRVLEKNWAGVKASGGLDKVAKIVRQESSNTREMMDVAIDILRRL